MTARSGAPLLRERAPAARRDPFVSIRAELAEVEACYSKLAHVPLRVSARLLRPLALNDALLLDGILRCAAARCYLCRPELAGMPLPDDVRVPLPLAYSSGTPRDAYPLASLAFADQDAEVVVRPGEPALLEHAVTWHKTWEHSGDDYLVFRSESGKPLRGKISLGGAQFKGWAMSLTVLQVRRLWWWARGDAAEVARLLEHAPAVGKKASWGFGLVDRWEVEEAAEDWSERRADGRPTRPLPAIDPQPPRSIRATGALPSPAYRAREWRDIWLPD